MNELRERLQELEEEVEELTEKNERLENTLEEMEEKKQSLEERIDELQSGAGVPMVEGTTPVGISSASSVPSYDYYDEDDVEVREVLNIYLVAVLTVTLKMITVKGGLNFCCNYHWGREEAGRDRSILKFLFESDKGQNYGIRSTSCGSITQKVNITKYLVTSDMHIFSPNSFHRLTGSRSPD